MLVDPGESVADEGLDDVGFVFDDGYGHQAHPISVRIGP